MKELWCFTGNRISVRFEYESHDASGQWWRSHGNEHWEFDENGLMRRRDASINAYKIEETERRYRWERQGGRGRDRPSRVPGRQGGRLARGRRGSDLLDQGAEGQRSGGR